MAVVLLLVYVLLITPLKGGAAFHWQEEKNIEIRWGMMIWGMKTGGKIHFPQTHSERLLAAQRIYRESRGKIKDCPAKKVTTGEKILRLGYTVWLCDHARALLKRTCHLERIQLNILWGLKDAGLCALLQTLLSGLFSAVSQNPHIRLKSYMQMNGNCAVQGGCIVRIRLGNLLLAGTMGLIAYYKARRKEEKLWNAIPLKT